MLLAFRALYCIIIPDNVCYLKSIVPPWGVPEQAISVIYNSVSPLPETYSWEELRRLFGCEEKISLTCPM